MTFGNRVSAHLKRVSNISKKPVLWALQLKNISKDACSLTAKCQSILNKNSTFTAELLPSRSISKKFQLQRKSHTILTQGISMNKTIAYNAHNLPVMFEAENIKHIIMPMIFDDKELDELQVSGE
jgi:hypothetical protein